MNTTILNREFKHPPDGWYQIEAKGFHPCVGECDGKEVRIVQVIDDKAITSIVNRFNTKAAAAELSHGSEMLIDREHFKDNPEKETVAYGWAKKMRPSPDGSGVDVEKPWTGTGQKAVDSGDYRFFSTEYDGPNDSHFEPVPSAEIPVAIQNKYKGFTFLRPLELTGLTLTNAHNNKGQKGITITNRDKTFAGARASADRETKNKGHQMKSVCTLLGLSAEADEQSVHAAVTKIQNRLATLEPLEATNLTLKNRNTELEAEQCDALMDAHGLKSDDASRAKLKPVLITLKNREDRQSFLKDCVKVETTTATATIQTKLHNRDTKPPVKAKGAEGQNTAADQAQATKIMNRAAAIKKAIPTITDASATIQAQREIEAEG